MNKKAVILVLLVSLCCLPSCKFVSLSEAEKAAKMAQFDPRQFSEDFWNNTLMANLDKATDMKLLCDCIAADPEEARKKYSKTVGIGSVYYYFASGKGRVVSIGDETIGLSLQSEGSEPDLYILTDFIFGNAIRNATGLIDVNDFPNSQDFNNISSQLNNIVTSRVLPPILEQVREGMMLNFVGCAEISNEDTDLHPMTLVPVSLELVRN